MSSFRALGIIVGSKFVKFRNNALLVRVTLNLNLKFCFTHWLCCAILIFETIELILSAKAVIHEGTLLLSLLYY
jgi:hypothetical protein